MFPTSMITKKIEHTNKATCSHSLLTDKYSRKSRIVIFKRHREKSLEICALQLQAIRSLML